MPAASHRRLAQVISAVTSASRVWRTALVLLFIAVAYLALTPTPPANVDLGWDKLNHVAAFAALAFAARLGFPDTRRGRKLSLWGLFSYGAAIEIVQLFVPGRAAEWGDLFADSIGIACGALLAAGLLRLMGTTSRQQSK